MSGRRWTPAVSRTFRGVLAGVVWSAAGAMLLAWAAAWLFSVDALEATALGLGGALLGIGAWRLLFAKLAARNTVRIAAGSERACLFGFQSLRSYLVMSAMMMLGILLRHSAAPREALAVVYAAIGSALLLSSLGYYRQFTPVRVGGFR